VLLSLKESLDTTPLEEPKQTELVKATRHAPGRKVQLRDAVHQPLQDAQGTDTLPGIQKEHPLI
jgi:hypothetical protein